MNTSSKNRAGYKGGWIALLATLLVGLPAVADDTELYFGKSTSTKPSPLVMLTLDYRPNLGSTFCSDVSTSCKTAFGYSSTDPAAIGTQIYNALDVTSGAVTLFDSFRAVFKVIFLSNVADGMSIGFMMNHDDTGTSNGAYVLRGFKLFQAGDGNGAKQQLLDIMKAIPIAHGNVSHEWQGKELFFELYRYLTGQDVLNGHKGYTDYSSNDATRNLDNELVGGGACTALNVTTIGGLTEVQRDALPSGTAVGTGLTSAQQTTLSDNCLNRNKSGNTYYRISSKVAWDKTIESSNRYISPYTSGDWSCSGTYSINMLFGVSNKDGDSDAAINKTLANQGMSEWGGAAPVTTMIGALHQHDIAGGQATGVPNIAGNQTLTSYFLSPSTGPTKSKVDPYAAAGGTGGAIAALDDPRALFTALSGIFNDINAVSSSYVAVTVPVNADNRVTSLPNLFLALFQVDENGKPYWPGNVKKLDILTTTDPSTGTKTLAVNDALGAAAFNPITGRLKDSALTLWTVPTAADVVAFDATKGEVTGRDGSSVRRGGAGHKIPDYIAGTGVGEKNSTSGARQIFLEPATVVGTNVAGNPMVGLDASSTSTLLADVTIQDLLGVHATSLTATCPGRDGSNYCVTFIDQVLTAAGQATTGTTATKAQVATRLFLRWIRGLDAFNEGGVSSGFNGLTTTAQRKWLLGDVLHSRPVAVNYGIRTGYSEFNQDVRLIFGSNDGLLRMVRSTASGSTKPSAVTQQGAAYGQEVWAFMPRELLAHVPTLAMTTSDVGLNRPYGADGPPALLTIDTNGDGIINNVAGCTVGAVDCDRAWVYFGLRRGGKSYYAVDISNPDATLPNLLWKIGSSTTGFTELGMTFSSPRVGWVRFEDVSGTNQFGTPLANVPVPVVIFGGGYNGHAVTSGDHHQSGTGGPSKDTILGTPFTGNDPQGNAIYIVHARTGQLIWKATLGSSAATATNFQAPEMKHGIAAPVSPMDSDGDGILDRLYVADTGGRVWRVDLPEFVPPSTPAPACVTTSTDVTTKFSTCAHRANTWKATLLADLRPANLVATPNDDLRFFHGATLVRRARDGIGDYDAVYLGSGDREHPQSETNKHNWFFLLKDRRTTSGDTTSFTAYTPSDLKNVTDACFATSSSPTCTDAQLTDGWRLALEQTGEKNLSEPFIGGEGVIFTTYLPQGIGPDDAQCVPLGASRLYQVSLETGAPLPFLHHDGEVSPTLIKDDRWINLYSGIDGGVVAVSPDFWITSTGKSGKNPPQKPIRFYWRENGVDAVK